KGQQKSEQPPSWPVPESKGEEDERDDREEVHRRSDHYRRGSHRAERDDDARSHLIRSAREHDDADGDDADECQRRETLGEDRPRSRELQWVEGDNSAGHHRRGGADHFSRDEYRDEHRQPAQSGLYG